MNTLSRWMRDNLVIVACGLVMLLSVASLFWPIGPQIAAFKEQLARADARYDDVRDHLNRRERIPSDNADDPMRVVNLTVNEEAVDALNAIYRTMRVSYETILEDAIAFNRGDRRFIREGLFPTQANRDGSWRPSNTVALGAIDPYRRAFGALYQRMNAGTPPSASQIEQRMQRVEDRFQAETVEGTGEGSAELTKRKLRARKKLYMERAKTLSVYAEPPGTGEQGQFTAGVFQATRLATRVDTPPTAELWKSQMQLWIQQDLVDAIALTNRDPQSGGPLPVTEAPVKRLLALNVDPDYLKPPGLDAGGSAGSAKTAPEALDKPLPLHFDRSPTGRASNPLYDVWLAEIRVIIDSAAIPRLLNALGRTNFITPIHRELRPVDPPVDAQFENGYVYGDAVDLVELSLKLETLWMRDWTVGAYQREAVEAGDATFGPMPDSVRVELGIPPRAEGFQREGGEPTGDGGWQRGGGYREGPEAPGRNYQGERY